MKDCSTVLVSMPWELLDLPSIQLGLLKPVLEAEGYPTAVRSLYLDFMSFLLSQLPGVQLDEYRAIASHYWTVGLGDWIFAVPPYRDLDSTADAAYLAYARDQGVPQEMLTRAVQIRSLVPAFLERCAEEMLAVKPQIVGFTSSFSQNVPSLVLSKLLKLRNPALTIIFGGANCESVMGAALLRSFAWIDVVVRGEGERVLPAIVHDLLSGEPLRPHPGLCYRHENQPVVIEQRGAEKVALDAIPIPVYDEYFERLQHSPFHSQVAPGVKLLFESSRGCWWGEKHHCTFCGLNGSSMAFRSKSAARITHEIFTLAAKYRRLDFEAVDNIIDMKYLQTVVPKLRDARNAGYDFSFFYETKANLKKEQLRLMSDAGITTIQPGIESLSTPVLKLMNKGVTALQNIRLLKWAAQYGVRMTYNIIYGFPGEPADEYDRMAGVMESLTHLQPPNLVRLRVQRFSPYHDTPASYGLQVTGPASFYRFLYAVDEPTLNDLAYDFEYRHVDGRDPQSYIPAIRDAIERWQAIYATGDRELLRYYRGPGFLRISDRRPNLPARGYLFGETEARIYLSCESGASAAASWSALRLGEESDITVEEVQAILDELVLLKLVYREDGQYLSLAVPANPDATGDPLHDDLTELLQSSIPIAVQNRQPVAPGT